MGQVELWEHVTGLPHLGQMITEEVMGKKSYLLQKNTSNTNLVTITVFECPAPWH